MRSILMILIAVMGCKGQDPFQPGPVREADREFADVFKPWDGTWRGIFYIYEDTAFRSRIPSPTEFKDWTGKVVRDSISVTQVYKSETPFFQGVTITDHYAGRTEESIGVNKVEGGELRCIVKKPIETVVHRGQRLGPATIVWSRDERNPLRKEYFLETATDSVYTIEGWGYYGNDDVSVGPRSWFQARYTRE